MLDFIRNLSSSIFLYVTPGFNSQDFCRCSVGLRYVAKGSSFPVHCNCQLWSGSVNLTEFRLFSTNLYRFLLALQIFVGRRLCLQLTCTGVFVLFRV